MDTFLISGLLFVAPVTCFIVTFLHGAELDASVVAEVILLIVHQVDYLLTEAYRVEEHFIRYAALYDGDDHFRFGGHKTCFNSNSVWLFVPGT